MTVSMSHESSKKKIEHFFPSTSEVSLDIIPFDSICQENTIAGSENMDTLDPIIISDSNSPVKGYEQNRLPILKRNRIKLSHHITAKKQRNDAKGVIVSSESDEELTETITRNKNMYDTRSLTPKPVEKLPNNINGNVAFQLHYDNKECQKMKSSQDGRSWKRYNKSYTYYFKSSHGTRLLALKLHAQLLAILPPKQAFQLKSNRTVNIHGGKGANVPGDLALEFMNMRAKDALNSLRGNMASASIERCGRILQGCNDIIDSYTTG
ncbi:unnamed protein product [Mytilus edulis]|uniref:Uncharacterized protein n=1 Tax=Mytilus edulis TaxID=6550 RepID=A0A8S3TLZ3_MYTED|nr:unnamed protein product [Mytilus edulis]